MKACCRWAAVAFWFLSGAFATGAEVTSFTRPPPAPADLLERAEAAEKDRFRILEKWHTPPRREDGHLDWSYRGSDGDKETAWMLNRHAVLVHLGQAWEETGKESYRRTLNALLKDWIRANPYPDRLTFSAPWRALEVARRILDAWPYLYFTPDLLDEESRAEMRASLLDHADALHEHASFWGGNHLLTEKLALLQLAVLWPDFEKSGEWRAHADATLAREFLRQSYPDGSYKELSNHYQRVVLRNAHTYLRLLAAAGVDASRRPVRHRIVKMWEFFAGVTRPDGHGPLNNASDLEDNAAFLREVADFYERPDWHYIATNGAEGRPPEGTPSRHFPWAGQIILRDSWQRNGDWIYFDAGPYGTAHQHVDRLHVSAVLGGRPLLLDSGRYHYRPGALKNYFRGAEGHSTLLLNGEAALQAPRRVSEPLPVYFSEDKTAVLAAAEAAFAAETGSLRAPPRWTRSLLYDKAGVLVILDHVEFFGLEEVAFRWQFASGLGETEARRVLRPMAMATRLRPQFRSGSIEPPRGGFFSAQYNRKENAPMGLFHGWVRGPATFAWVVQHPDEPPVRVNLRQNGRKIVLELQGGFGKRRYVVQFRPGDVALRVLGD